MLDPSVLILAPGAVFCRRYEIVRCIKAGGMGAVYEVIDTRTDVPCALKVMLPSVIGDPEMRARFELEARITARVESSHIVRVTDADVDAETGTPFLVMELLRGDELGSLLARRKTLPQGEVVVYLHQTSLALDKTHNAGIVHRDLKPENLFLTYRDDGSPSIKILDFGIAKLLEHTTLRSGTVAIGTPLYMAPEQARGERALIGPTTDIYALAHIAYTLLVGEAYWAEELRTMGALFPFFSTVLRGVIEPPSRRAERLGVALSAAFDTWFLKATAVKPSARFDRATAAVTALAVALSVPIPRPSLASIDPDLAAAREPSAVAVAPIAAREDATEVVAGPGSGSPPRTATHLKSSAPVDSRAPAPTDLNSFEGVWRAPGGSTYCVRVIHNELRCAYCYGGDRYLTGEVYEWRLAGTMAFARFKWFESSMSGYIYLDIKRGNRLVGGWWNTQRVPPLFDSVWTIAVERPGVFEQLKLWGPMNPIELTRSDSQKLPIWAEQFFEALSTSGWLAE